ncbi:GYDIA family GHMP kinase [Hanstruepera ponticola]|uniref:GYDIA family GHMP kinase n=1 Tax=Hanstruepera ponticola TaxID=2042995 RepID=UPI001782A1B0|nr:GYDIA family GHMP kinase [Hanstruepera ponticola]
MENSEYYSNGKLLLTGEYLVLDGALGLALPTKYGQYLNVETNDSNFINWKSYDQNGEVWFKTILELNDLDSKDSSDDLTKRLLQILKAALQLNPDFLETGCSVKTKLTFPKDWGLGTSSTLINNIAQWAQVDPYELLKKTFGGSGYDIACAQHNTAITYRLIEAVRDIQTVNFNPSFKDCLYFVYLNKKQNSRDAIESYRQNTTDLTKDIETINTVTENIITCKTLSDFENLINTHEQILSSILNQKPIKERLFSDFQGSAKSLGAWGGDFILATATENPSAYFKAKGFETVISYNDLIL